MSVLDRLFSVEYLRQTVKRFWLSVFCALGTFVLAVIEIHDLVEIDEETLGRGVAVFSCLYLWFAIVRIIHESGNLSVLRSYLLCFAGALGMGSLFALSPLFAIYYAIIVPTLLLAVMVAPYLSGGDDWSFWQYNRKIWLGAFLSFLIALLFTGGLYAALASIDHLFGVQNPDELYGDIMAFAFCILGPVYALSRVPGKFEFTKEECDFPPGLRFIANWVGVPIIFVYLLILYIYFIKIMMSAEMPSGHLAYMISGFIGVGVLGYLAFWPLSVGAGAMAQLKLFYRIFFPALFVLVGFHFFAVWERVNAYGITEQRYVLMISAFWFLIIAMTKSLPGVPLRIIPATLCLLLAVASFGPWGMVSVAGKSQSSILEKLLVKHDFLEDGRVVSLRDGREIPIEDRVSISSILDYMCYTKRFGVIDKWFDVKGDDKDKEEFACSSFVRDITKEQLGFDYVHYRVVAGDEKGKFKISAVKVGDEAGIDVAGYDVFVKDIYVYVSRDNVDKASALWSRRVNAFDRYDVKFSFDGNNLRIAVDEYEPVIIDISGYISEKAGHYEMVDDLYIVGENDDLSYKIDFSYINGSVDDGSGGVFSKNMSFDFLFKAKK